jgi:catechol 2,3-dioxygenase-like lactoylglutathione lyase family enzyme
VQLHHATLFVRDAERSLRFYRDALGFALLVDREYAGDWPTLLGVESKRLRAVILGDPKQPRVGQVELVTFAEPVPDGPPPSAPATGSVLISVVVDLEAVLPALLAAGATDLRRTTLENGFAAASVRDPDGILVELLDATRRTEVQA